MSGYLHPTYAQSLAEFGTPRELSRCGGWILERPISESSSESSWHDGMGCYPLFACRDWSQLPADIEELREQFVALSLVADPFGVYEVADLQRCFDMVQPFKDHFVADLHQPLNTIVSKHHRYYARRSLSQVEVEVCPNAAQFLDEWMALYATLIEKHHLKGIKAFSRTAFDTQLQVPGIVALRATHQGATVAAHLWYVQGEVAYSHLAASSAAGYDLMASYALYWFAIQHFTQEGAVRWLDIGAGAGAAATAGGLSEFKRGWSTSTRPTYFCGRIFNPAQYNAIVEARGVPSTGYFPAYRRGEFG